MSVKKPYEVKVAGHYKKLLFQPRRTECGSIYDGVGFNFEGEGSWVISLDELKHLVTMADEARALEP